MQCLNPFKLSLVVEIKSPFYDYISKEDKKIWYEKGKSALHHKFYKQKIRGEWYKLSKLDIQYLKSLKYQKCWQENLSYRANRVLNDRPKRKELSKEKFINLDPSIFELWEGCGPKTVAELKKLQIKLKKLEKFRDHNYSK